MGLTETKIKDLKAKDFHKLFEKHKAKWIGMVKAAHDFTKTHVCGGKEPQADDILKALLIMLEPDEILGKHQKDNRCNYQKYREAFGDYIIHAFQHEGTAP